MIRVVIEGEGDPTAGRVELLRAALNDPDASLEEIGEHLTKLFDDVSPVDVRVEMER